MALFAKRDPAAAAFRAIALVVAAEAPPQGAPSFGQEARSTIRVLVDGHQLTTTARHSEKHWLVRGMEVPVLLDPARPGVFDVDWDAVPAMAQRAAANDPALADPVGAAQRVAQALGVPPGDLRATTPRQMTEALAVAAAASAPPGRLRAVVLVSTVRGHYAGGDERGIHDGVSLRRGSQAVLSVTLPGRAPYAVFVPDFKVPRGRSLLFGPLQAVVSAADPRSVDVLWDEAPTLTDMISDRAAESARRTNEQTAAIAEHIRAASEQALRQYPTAPAYPVPGAPRVPPQMREVLVNNLRMALRYVSDPGQRQMMIDQYRAMGVEIGPDELNT